MKHLSLALCTAAVVFAASAPAKADFQIIRWTSGLCETWNMGLPTRPFPFDYKVLVRGIPTFEAALKAKQQLLSTRQCTF
jgi:hypothetical protein